MSAPPVYFTVPCVVAVLGGAFSGRRVRSWLARAGLLSKRAGTLVVDADRLAVELPELYRRLIAEQPEDPDDY